MAVKKTHPRGRILEQRHENLVREGNKLAQHSRQLITDAKRLVVSSEKLIAASRQRKKITAR